jgi:hypothetical protein
MMMRSWIDDAVMRAARSYLRTCSCGGMPQKTIDVVETHVEAMADLKMFGVAIAEEMNRQGLHVEQNGTET